MTVGSGVTGLVSPGAATDGVALTKLMTFLVVGQISHILSLPVYLGDNWAKFPSHYLAESSVLPTHVKDFRYGALFRPESHLGLRSRLDLAPKRLESRLSHHLMAQLEVLVT